MIKRLTECVRQYKKASLLTPIFVTLEVVMEVMIPLLMATLIDSGINAGNLSYVLKTGALLVAAAFISLIFGALSGKYAAEASAGFARNVRHDMYYNIQEFSFSNIDRFSTSGIVTRLTTDVSNVQNAFQMIIRVAVRCPVMLIFSLVMAFGINPRLSLIFLAVIPILAAGLFLIMTKAHPIFERVFRTYDKLNNVVQENLRGIRAVKSYVREDYEKEKFSKVSKSIFNDYSRAEKLLAFNSPLMQLSMYACILLISWFGAKFIVAGSMTTGQLMSIISYMSQILMSLMMLSMVFVMITIAKASAERITEILEEKSDIVNNDTKLTQVANGDICFDNVSFGYVDDNDKKCLRNIDLKIKSGQTVGIIGGTGSSKTTLVQLIPRLYDVSEGALYVGGVDVRNYDIESLRNQVAVVLQKNVLFSGTVSENLRWGCEDSDDSELRRVCRISQADEFIEAMPQGYDTYIEQGGTNVSGGQKQRLCIARALLKKPKILILDDSTSAVDTTTDLMIRQGLREYMPHTTKIIIAQRIASVQDADLIVVMNEGRIDDVGTHSELMLKSSIYREVYRSQTKEDDSYDAA